VLLDLSIFFRLTCFQRTRIRGHSGALLGTVTSGISIGQRYWGTSVSHSILGCLVGKSFGGSALAAVAVGILVYDFAREGAIDVREVARGQNHFQDAPDEADFALRRHYLTSMVRFKQRSC
jgi:hypothetical protein